MLSETFGPGLNTLNARLDAAANFIERQDYHPRYYGSEMWYVAGDSAVLAEVQRKPIRWENDQTLPDPVHITQKLTRKYSATLVYDMYELYTWQDNQGDPERDALLGQQAVEVEYSVTLVPMWIPL